MSDLAKGAALRAAAARFFSGESPAFRLVAAVAITLLAFATYAPALFGNWMVFGQDTVTHDYLMHWYGARVLAENGRVPLWCPYLFNGFPFVGSFALCPFYPSMWLYLLMPMNAVFTMQYVLTLVVAGACMAVWLRVVGVPRWIALWGGVAIMLSGHFLTLTYAGHLQKMMAIAWAPLALAATRKICSAAMTRERNLPAPTGRWICALGVALGAQLLASHSQIFYATVLACALYAVAPVGGLVLRALVSPEPGLAGLLRSRPARATARLTGSMVFGLVLAILISAVQFFPGYETAQVSNRSGGFTYEQSTDTSYPPSEVLEYIMPSVFGDSVRGSSVPYFGAWGERIVSDYVGAPVVLLALLGLSVASLRLRVYFLSLILISLLLGMGAFTPLFAVFHAAMPFFDRFRSPGTYMFLANIGLVTLAALGLARLLSLARGAGRSALLTPLAAVVAAMGLALLVAGLWNVYGRDPKIATAEELRQYHVSGRLALLGGELLGAALLVLVSARSPVWAKRRLAEWKKSRAAASAPAVPPQSAAPTASVKPATTAAEQADAGKPTSDTHPVLRAVTPEILRENAAPARQLRTSAAAPKRGALPAYAGPNDETLDSDESTLAPLGSEAPTEVAEDSDESSSAARASAGSSARRIAAQVTPVPPPAMLLPASVRYVPVVFALFALLLPMLHNRRYVQFEPLDRYQASRMYQPVYNALKEEKDQPKRIVFANALRSDSLLHGVAVPTGYHPITLGRYERLMAAVGYNSTRLGDLFALQFAYSDGAGPSPQPPAPGLWRPLRQLSTGMVWRWGGEPRPYATFQAEVLPVSDLDGAARAVADSRFESGMALVEAPVMERLQRAGYAVNVGLQDSNAELARWEGTQMTLRASSRGAAILPVAEPYAPGWHARTAEGAPLPIVPANVAQRAIVLPGGPVTVTMFYDPFSYRLGAFVSLITALGMLHAYVYRRRQRVAAHPVVQRLPQVIGPRRDGNDLIVE